MISIYLGELRKIFDFGGRTSRKVFWSFALVHTILVLFIACIIALGIQYQEDYNEEIFIYIMGALFLLMPFILLTTVSITTRRFHDINRSGWYQLYGFLPYIGIIIVFTYMCFKSVDENNRYGKTF